MQGLYRLHLTGNLPSTILGTNVQWQLCSPARLDSFFYEWQIAFELEAGTGAATGIQSVAKV